MKESTADYRLLRDGRIRTYHRGSDEIGGGVSEYYRIEGDSLFYERTVDLFDYTVSCGVLEAADGGKRYFQQSEYGREEFFDWDHASEDDREVMRNVLRNEYLDEAEADTVSDESYRSIAMKYGIIVSAAGTVEVAGNWPDRPIVANHEVKPLEQADEGQATKTFLTEQEPPVDEKAPAPDRSMAGDTSRKTVRSTVLSL